LKGGFTKRKKNKKQTKKQTKKKQIDEKTKQETYVDKLIEKKDFVRHKSKIPIPSSYIIPRFLVVLRYRKNEGEYTI